MQNIDDIIQAGMALEQWFATQDIPATDRHAVLVYAQIRATEGLKTEQEKAIAFGRMTNFLEQFTDLEAQKESFESGKEYLVYAPIRRN